ncbi:MAG: methyltransferase [Lachnospiraceae bacterium]|nr:methyltransferase [Lachnospiraceae bacterium]
MVQKIWNQILENVDVRQNLSKLRESIKDNKNKEACKKIAQENELVLENLLQSEDAKTRKNTVLLIGDLQLSSMQMCLWRAYEKEETLFVRSSYLIAMQKMDMTALLKPMKAKWQMLSETEVEEINKKHIREEMQELRKLILSIEGIKKHKFIGWQKESEIILLANRRHLETVLAEIKQLPDVSTSDAKLLNAGIRLKTVALEQLMEVRTWQEMLFLVPGMKTCEKDPLKAAETIVSSKLVEFLKERHKGEAPFYFRVEVKMQTASVTNSKKNDSKSEQEKGSLEEKIKFVKKFVAALEEKSKGKFINTTSDYEFEIRMVENKDGKFNVMVKLFTMEDSRFDYRKEVVSSSIRPVNAALLVQLAKEYMVEEARVLDPFCGVGTMLIERQKKIGAATSYGLDIFEEAVEKARRNTENAGQIIHYVNRDSFTFTHEYLFDEIFTNMPFVQGRKTPLEIYEIYEKFFETARKLVKQEGIIVIYTHDKTYVDKLYVKAGFNVLKKCQINVKEDTWLYVMKK